MLETEQIHVKNVVDNLFTLSVYDYEIYLGKYPGDEMLEWTHNLTAVFIGKKTEEKCFITWDAVRNWLEINNSY